MKDGNSNAKSTILETPQSEDPEEEPKLIVRPGDPRQLDIRGSLYKPMSKACKVSYSREFLRNMEQEQNLQNLKNFIDSNYRESDMIDYDLEHKLHDR